jgi:hypothetical protein
VGASSDTFADDSSDSDVLAISQDDAGMASFDWDSANVSEVSLGNDEADVIYNFQTDYDFIELEGALLRSTVEEGVGDNPGEDGIQGVLSRSSVIFDEDGIQVVMSGSAVGFDLSMFEFGLVSSDASGLDADQLSDAELVSELLDLSFNFTATANERINTTLFAVTAEDDDNITAIWAHTQSHASDDTVDVFELSLLATVHTRGDEFQLENFLPEPVPVLYVPV